MSNGHAFLAPSASSRWLNCTASPGFIANLGDQVDRSSSVYADEGTKAHELAEDALLVGINADEFEDATEEMREVIQGYLDFVRELAEDDEITTESKVPLFYAPESTGTADTVILKESTRTLVTVDLKYGMGVSVQALENTQLAIYMRSVVEARGLTGDDIDTVEMYIYQPRVIGEEAVRSWVIGWDDFIDFTNWIGDEAKRILGDPHAEDLEFSASEKNCRFCPAAPLCKAHASMLLDETPLEMEVITDDKPLLPDPKTLTVEQLSAIYDNSSAIKKWLETIAPHLFYLTEKGDDTGYKVVEGRKGNKAWKDAEAAEKFLAKKLKKDQRTTAKVITPTQAEKELKKVSTTPKFMEQFEELFDRAPGKPVLAKLDDKRPALTVKAEEEFEALVD